MSTKYSFRRYEKKYILNTTQYQAMLQRLEPYMKADKFGESTVCNVYYDTHDYSLIRASIEKPVYKEKLRVRSYGVPEKDGGVFVEIKKKYNGVVYKRRVEMKNIEAKNYLTRGMAPAQDSQIFREIDWFCRSRELEPKVYIAYDRAALIGREDKDLRVTFDRNIRWRDHDLELTKGDAGELLLMPEQVLMEIKIPGVTPLWLAHLLCDLDIYPTAFSKYGSCYKKLLCDNNEKLRIGVTDCA